MGPDSSRAPRAQCSQISTLPAPQIITDGWAYRSLTLHLSIRRSRWCCSGTPPSCFLQWSPSSFVVDDVSYSCAEHFMMADKARLFQDHRAEELILSSLDPRAHKRISRGVCNFDNATWDRVREAAVITGNFSKF